MVSLICYNLKEKIIYTFSFNQDQNFIKKNTVHNFQTLARYKEQRDGT